MCQALVFLTALFMVMLGFARFGPCHPPNTALGPHAAELWLGASPCLHCFMPFHLPS